MWGEVLVACSDLSYPSPGRFRALGAEEQGELSDRERCGIILNQVLAAESPLCHLGATQVGSVCVQRGREGWQAGGAFWDPLGIWWSFQVVGRRSGLGVPGTPGERVAWKEAEASGEGQGGPHPHSWPASSPHLCPQVLLREPGWQQLEQRRAQQRTQALQTLRRGLRICISQQRLRLLPRMQARVRGLQARCAGALRL